MTVTSKVTVTSYHLTLTIPARVTLWAHFARATFFIHHRGLAAFGTQIADLLGRRVGGHLGFDGMPAVAAVRTRKGVRFLGRHFDGDASLLAQVRVEHLANAIRQGADAVRAEAQRPSAAEAAIGY